MSNIYRLLKLAIIMVAFSSISTPANANTLSNTENLNSAAVYTAKLEQLNLPLSVPATRQLERKIDQYVTTGGRSTERMLARMELYFPVFERYLLESKLPNALKYLSIAESLLQSRAVSAASAAGLWQLMPRTARSYGLRVDGIVDERLDVHLSTQAALDMLTELYTEYGDWKLALAAYNCGPARVNRAIRQANSTDYQQVVRFLPRETRQYLSAYLAAAYTANFYQDHGLQPRLSNWNSRELSELVVYRQLRLRDAAEVCGMEYKDLSRLNPAFLRGYVPNNKQGYRLLVPAESVYALQRFVWQRDNLVQLPRQQEAKLAIEVAAKQGFDAYRWLMGVSTEVLIEYNDLSFAEYAADQLVLGAFRDAQRQAMRP